MNPHIRKWNVTKSLLEALALLLVDADKLENLNQSNFQEFLDHNEFGLALDELAAVVNDHGIWLEQK